MQRVTFNPWRMVEYKFTYTSPLHDLQAQLSAATVKTLHALPARTYISKS